MSEPAPKRASKGNTEAGRGTDESRTWSLLLGLERDARHAETAAALVYTIVNQTRRLIAYRQAVLVRRRAPGRFAVEAVSNVATVERNAPYVVWMRAVLRHLDKADDTGQSALSKARAIAPGDLPERLAKAWQEWWPAHVLWQPLLDANGAPAGGLIFVRETPAWTESEGVLLDQLADAYAHAWRALGGMGKTRTGGMARRVLMGAVALALVGVLAIPVRQSAIAPARIAAQDPQVIASPLDGVIDEVRVRPNEVVRAGDILFTFEPAELVANREVAVRALAVAEAELRRAESQAFGDPRSKGEVALKQAEVALKQAEAGYSQSLVERSTVRAPSAGIAVFGDANDLRGRPVRTGERLMEIADPAHARIAIDLPVADAIEMRPGAEVQMFLDVAPLAPIEGRLKRASFEAGETPEGTLAYQVSAELVGAELVGDDNLSGETALPRIGLRGSAKIYGEPVPLAVYLFRRPIAAARQFIGF
jgi:multidrug resistance efflux pump